MKKAKIRSIAKTVINLNKLAHYIQDYVPQSNLSMSKYRSNRTSGISKYSFTRRDLEHPCGSSGCALGWSPLVPDFKHLLVDDELWVGDELRIEKFSAKVFPELHDTTFQNEHWKDVFSASLSSDKVEVVQRLFDKANELEKQLWT